MSLDCILDQERIEIDKKKKLELTGKIKIWNSYFM